MVSRLLLHGHRLSSRRLWDHRLLYENQYGELVYSALLFSMRRFLRKRSPLHSSLVWPRDPHFQQKRHMHSSYPSAPTSTTLVWRPRGNKMRKCGISWLKIASKWLTWRRETNVEIWLRRDRGNPVCQGKVGREQVKRRLEVFMGVEICQIVKCLGKPGFFQLKQTIERWNFRRWKVGIVDYLILPESNSIWTWPRISSANDVRRLARMSLSHWINKNCTSHSFPCSSWCVY